MQFDELAHHPHLGPLLARWHVAEWAHLYPAWTVEVAEEEFAAMAVPGRVPTTFVAFAGDGRAADDVLGSVSIIADDELPGFEHVTPWLASLYVPPHARSGGVGRALEAHAVERARAMGIDELHLFTSGQEAFHVDRGWRVVARTEAHGHPATVMVKRTSPYAARRSVVSTWSTDRDTAGAYSFLRVGGTPDDRRRVAGAVHGVVRFAGEHTSWEYPGTLHGAWFSGERAADDVLADGRHGTVVVVGAGMAGLAAARRLRDAGRQVVVLEAKDVPGGRARTDGTLGGTVHLGGAWIHGADGHPLMTFGVTGTPSTWDEVATFVAGEGRVDDGDLDERLARVQRALRALAADLPDGPDGDVAVGSVGPGLVDAEADDDAVMRTVLRAWFDSEYENLYAAPLDEVSLRWGTEPFRLPGDDLLVTSSLGDVIAAAADGLDVRCGARVRTIALRDPATGGPPATVGLEDGTVADADDVVVTVPIGALRGGRIVFAPPLPDPVVRSLDRIGAGPVAKAFFTYDHAWWTDPCWFVAADPPATFPVWVDVSATAGRPMLLAFAAGARAPGVEVMSEDARCRLADAELAGAMVVPEPEA